LVVVVARARAGGGVEGMTLSREKGVVAKRVIHYREGYAIVVRRLFWKGREHVDVRLAKVNNDYRFDPKYTTKGVRMSVSTANELVMALVDVLGSKGAVEEVEEWAPVR